MTEMNDDLEARTRPASHRYDSDLQNDPKAIRAEAESTRARMSDTLDEIGERLNPNVMKEKVKESIREATIGRVETMARNAADRVNDTSRSIVDTIRENPVPAVLVGVGLAWLVFGSGRNESRDRGRYQRQGDEGWSRTPYPDEEWGDTGMRRSRGPVEGMVETVKDKASDWAHRAKDAAEQLTDRATETTEYARETLDHASERAKDAAGHAGERVREVAGEVRQTSRLQARHARDAYFENPLAIGAVTMALGFAVGLSVPETDAEASLMGEKRNEVVDKVGRMARESGEKVIHVAERVVDEGKRVAKEAAREEGLIKA